MGLSLRDKIAKQIFNYCHLYTALNWDNAEESEKENARKQADAIHAAYLSHYSEGVLTGEEINRLLIKRFAQTVEYGGMCQDCCSATNAKDSKKVGCEMAENDLNPDDYCPQQIMVINEGVKEIMALIKNKSLADSLRTEAALEPLKTRLKELEAKLNDRETDLIQAKKEERERIIKIAQKNGLVCSKTVTKKNNCTFCKRFWQALNIGNE